MHIYIYIYIYVYLQIHIYIYTYIYIRICVCCAVLGNHPGHEEIPVAWLQTFSLLTCKKRIGRETPEKPCGNWYSSDTRGFYWFLSSNYIMDYWTSLNIIPSTSMKYSTTDPFAPIISGTTKTFVRLVLVSWWQLAAFMFLNRCHAKSHLYTYMYEIYIYIHTIVVWWSGVCSIAEMYVNIHHIFATDEFHDT